MHRAGARAGCKSIPGRMHPWDSQSRGRLIQASGCREGDQIWLWPPWRCGRSLGLSHAIPIPRFCRLQEPQLPQPGHTATAPPAPSQHHSHHTTLPAAPLRAEPHPSRAEQHWQGQGLEQAMAGGAKSQGPTHHTAHPSKPTLAQPQLAPGCTGGSVANSPEHPQAGQLESWQGADGRSSAPQSSLSH